MLPALILLMAPQGITLPTPNQHPLPFPNRAYQPTLFEPGLDGGTWSGFSRGEFTPDGRVLIGFRRIEDSQYPSKYRNALTASLARPDRLKETNTEHLDGFYEQNTNFVPGNGQLSGSEFAFGSYDTTLEEWHRIHWSYDLAASSDSNDPLFVSACSAGLPNTLQEDSVLNAAYPLPNPSGTAHMTVSYRKVYFDPQETLELPNPFRSDRFGNPSQAGNYTTYDLWIIRTHDQNFLTYGYECNPQNGGALVRPKDTPSGNTVFGKSVFARQAVRIIVDDVNQRVASSVVEPFETITAVVNGTPSAIRGIEPSVTADGKLVLFHGNGIHSYQNAPPADVFSPGRAVVTYIYNPDPSQPDTWTPPRPITTLPDPSELGGLSLKEFKDRYRLFRHPIHMPASGLSATAPKGAPFLAGENLNGTYPWVSKDGSFFNAYSTRSTDAFDKVNGTYVPSTREKSGGYACGDLTNWTIKHIDDPSLNPTRHGGPWAWPWFTNWNNQGAWPNSWGASTMGAGVRPGLWEPFLGQGTALPTLSASLAIPVMGLFLPVIDTYGEIRFEEGDGNYLWYLACNESLAVDAAATPQGESEAFVYDPTSTPDSSGKVPTALCELNDGAAFPQEVFWNGNTSQSYSEASQALREAVGGELLDPQSQNYPSNPALEGYPNVPFHENIGFKGQGIALSQEGRIRVDTSRRLGGETACTIQLFAKRLASSYPASGTTETLFVYGEDVSGTEFDGVRISLDSAGRVQAFLIGQYGTALHTFHVESRIDAIPLGSALADPTEGWRHIALTFRSGVSNGQYHILLELYLDGQREDFEIVPLNLPAGETEPPYLATVATAGLPPYYYVGPGTADTAAAVTESSAVWVLDEVAVSSVARTEEEIRRDAFVVPADTEFEDWPDGAPSLPAGLSDEEARWPVGVAYSSAVVALGEDLFNDTILSAPTGNPADARSCATCHLPSQGFAEGSALAEAVDGSDLSFNTPTLLNMVFGTHKTFSGSAPSLEEQAVFPLISGSEMGVQELSDVLARVNGNSYYSGEFQSLFGGPADKDSLTEALAMFLRTRVTGGTLPDTNPEGLPGQLMRGKALFFGKARCFSCHRGSNFSDDDFHNIRTVATTSNVADRGSFTGRPSDEGKLKTPTLRGLDLTGPYFHDGRFQNLRQVVEHYNEPFANTIATPKGVEDRDLVPLGLTSGEKADLVAFLRSLTE